MQMNATASHPSQLFFGLLIYPLEDSSSLSSRREQPHVRVQPGLVDLKAGSPHLARARVPSLPPLTFARARAHRRSCTRPIVDIGYYYATEAV